MSAVSSPFERTDRAIRRARHFALAEAAPYPTPAISSGAELIPENPGSHPTCSKIWSRSPRIACSNARAALRSASAEVCGYRPPSCSGWSARAVSERASSSQFSGWRWLQQGGGKCGIPQPRACDNADAIQGWRSTSRFTNSSIFL